MISLVLVDHALGVVGINADNTTDETVLILVLVDHALGAHFASSKNAISLSLNPCFSGPYSRSMYNFIQGLLLMTS